MDVVSAGVDSVRLGRSGLCESLYVSMDVVSASPDCVWVPEAPPPVYLLQYSALRCRLECPSSLFWDV